MYFSTVSNVRGKVQRESASEPYRSIDDSLSVRKLGEGIKRVFLWRTVAMTLLSLIDEGDLHQPAHNSAKANFDSGGNLFKFLIHQLRDMVTYLSYIANHSLNIAFQG